jgi:hypothetical protein
MANKMPHGCHQPLFPLNLLVLLVVVMLLAPSSSSAAGHWLPSSSKHKQRGLQQLMSSPETQKNTAMKKFKRCGTIAPPPNAPTMKALIRMETSVVQAADSTSFSVVVPVVFHVVHNGTHGMVPDAQLQDQLAVINKDFNGSGFSFQLLNVTYTNNPEWFGGINWDNADAINSPGLKMKQALRTGGAEVLNIYTVEMVDLLGYAYFPYLTMNNPAKQNSSRFTVDGVVLHYGTMPGGYIVPYNLGRTLTHEVCFICGMQLALQ